MKTKRFFAVVTSAVLAVSLLAGCSNTSASNGTSTASGSKQSEAVSTASWPKGAVQCLVPSKAGGVTDIYTRYAMQSLQKSTKGNFATVNFDTEAVGYANLRSAKADGSTLMFQHSTIICKYLTGNLSYDPAKEFTVVGEIANMGDQAVIAAPDAPYNTWDEFVSYCKKNPGKVSTAISTNGTTHFIFGSIENKCGIKLHMVECSSEADKLTNVAGHIINVANCSLANASEYEKAGKIKVLGLIGDGKANADFPKWKPIKDVTWDSNLYCFAPGKIDKATATAINEKLKGLTADTDYVAACKKVGGVAEWYDLDTCQQNFLNNESNLKPVAKILGILKTQ